MTLRIEIVTDPERFVAIGPAWQDLWQRAGGRIFQRHDWLSGWLEGMRARREIRLLIALGWDGPALVGALPFAVHRRSGLRMLHWMAQLFSDYCDCLIDPAQPSGTVLPALWDALWQHGGFDLVNLQQIRPDATCRALFGRVVVQGGPLQAGERSERCMGIDNNWPNGEAFFRSLNKKGRNNHTRGKRILAELGGEVTFRVIEPREPAEAEIAEIVRLKDAWMRVNDPASPLLAADGVVLRTLLRNAWASGLAKIFLLEAGGRIAAGSVNFVYAGRMEAYFTAYDTAYERASPGTILIVEYAKWSFDRGLAQVDFLRGDEGFKFRLANSETMLSSVAGSRTVMGHLAISGHRWWSWLRHRLQTPVVASEQALEAAD